MPVRVTPDDLTRLNLVDYPTGERFDVDDHGVLRVYDATGKTVAAHGYGRWAGVELLPDPNPEPPLLRSGTVVRIPGIDVPYVVDKGLATAGPHATLTFTTVDGRDWSDDRTVNAAAEPKDPALFEGGLRAAAERLSWPVSTEPAESVLSETTEPYVSVNVSVTSDDPDAVLKVIREALREGRLRIPTEALS